MLVPHRKERRGFCHRTTLDSPPPSAIANSTADPSWLSKAHMQRLRTFSPADPKDRTLAQYGRPHSASSLSGVRRREGARSCQTQQDSSAVGSSVRSYVTSWKLVVRKDQGRSQVPARSQYCTRRSLILGKISCPPQLRCTSCACPRPSWFPQPFCARSVLLRCAAARSARATIGLLVCPANISRKARVVLGFCERLKAMSSAAEARSSRPR